MIFKGDLKEYDNKYFMVGNDNYGSTTYVFVRHAFSFDQEDIGDFIKDPKILDDYKTVWFYGVKIEIMLGSVYYEDGMFMERLNQMIEVSWVDFNDALKEVKKSINNIGI